MRESYEVNEMRKAKKSDPNKKSQIMVEAGAEKLHYLEMQSKTPAAPPLTVFFVFFILQYHSRVHSDINHSG